MVNWEVSKNHDIQDNDQTSIDPMPNFEDIGERTAAHERPETMARRRGQTVRAESETTENQEKARKDAIYKRIAERMLQLPGKEEADFRLWFEEQLGHGAEPEKIEAELDKRLEKINNQADIVYEKLSASVPISKQELSLISERQASLILEEFIRDLEEGKGDISEEKKSKIRDIFEKSEFFEPEEANYNERQASDGEPIFAEFSKKEALGEIIDLLAA
ncbi:MAG: hypothetical protein ACOZBH_02960 [Patescibacteria group bacterium]